jgi:hypothetical protein
MQEDTISFKLSVEEREQVLQHAFPSEELQRKLRLGVREGKSLAFDLTYEHLEELAECLANAAEDAKSRKLRRAFDRLCDRVEGARSGLLRKNKGRYHVPKNRVLLLEDENAGKLYRNLFVTHFNDFNLAYGDYGEEHPEVQDTVGYTVWALGQEAREWKSADELAATVSLPAVRQELRDEWWVDAPGVLLSSRVLFPLKRFGLVETKTAAGDAVGRISMNDARVTPLFDKFLRFNLAD